MNNFKRTPTGNITGDFFDTRALLKLSEKKKARADKYQARNQATSPLKHIWDKDYGAVLPNPWGVRKSDGFDVQQIITQPRLSKLEQRSQSYIEWDKETAWYANMPLSCRSHSRDEAYLHEHDCQDCKAFMDYVRSHPAPAA